MPHLLWDASALAKRYTQEIPLEDCSVLLAKA